MSERPRNWKAMRADRVLAMAENRFGKRFASKEAAISELAKLSPREQRGLKKVNVSKAERARRTGASDRMIAGMSQGRAKPTQIISESRARASDYFGQAKNARGVVVPKIKQRIANEFAAKAISTEMSIASRVAKGQLTRETRGASQMTTIDERLKGLNKKQLQAKAPKAAKAPSARSLTAPQIVEKYIAAMETRGDPKEFKKALRGAGREAIDAATRAIGHEPAQGKSRSPAKHLERILYHEMLGRSRAVTVDAVDTGVSKGIGFEKARQLHAPQFADDAALWRENVQREMKSAPKTPKAAKARTPKTNPALVQDLAGKVNAALTGGDAEKLKSTLAEVKAAKLSKSDSHALAKAMGTPARASASGKAALERVTKRISNHATFLNKIKAVGGRSAAALGPVALPALAVVAASAAFSDSSHAAETRGEDRTAARAEGATEAAKVVTDMLTFGGAAEVAKSRADGRSMSESLARGTAKAAINMATFGVADMANEALADQGGVANVISDTVTKAAGKVGDMLGWSDAAREASAEARGVAKPGSVDVSAVGRDLARELFGGTAHASEQPASPGGNERSLAAELGGVVIGGVGGAMVLIGRENMKAPKAYNIDGRKIDFHGNPITPSSNAKRIVKGVGTIGVGMTLASLGFAVATAGKGKPSSEGKAFLNEGAERKAAEVPKAPASTVVAASAAPKKSDGQTAGYTRRGRNGQSVQVTAYRTPDRR